MKEKRDIYISDTDNQGMSSFQTPENYSGKTETVEVIEFDDWAKTTGLPKISIIKLDVEGSELLALKGMNETLQSFKPLVVVEINPQTLLQFNFTPTDILNYLKGFGYWSFLVLKGGELKRINEYQTGDTKNVLFIHEEKLKNYDDLF